MAPAEVYVAPTADAIAALPEAKYNATIAGLMPAGQSAAAGSPAAGSPATGTPATGSPATVPGAAATFHLSVDAALYGADRVTPVARLAASNFLGDPTVVVPVQTVGDWTLILTPSRQALPSANNGSAPAQTTAWIRTSLLTKDADLVSHIDVSLGGQTLTIVTPGQPDQSFAVGVGAPDTPTPTGVTGYIQARYLDASQGESVYPIQLTSLHSAAADEPFGGSDGGLIGVHFEQENTGQISHGCIRLPADAITAVNALPLGTLITITA
ncbi:L,D-transpeptidase [Subtercola endophyticus]|uniref:L,D-transpeptidase n=1 Tax=Subtercola endophyticus TaxID=2895559 RepID=UPI001E5AB485|nr:L,D-transpeptidase [Subtercola endophyticus]UFS58879.1 L,D-transpeptidase [Subtercola endophyticus]